MQLEPRTRRTAQNIQHTYSLDSRIYDVKTYPVQSPQGATILIYGHTNGVQVVWRGGRRLKPSKKTEKQNGSSEDNAVMIIDSDDEAPPAKSKFVDKPEFEETATTNTSPPEIIQTLDLLLGAAVQHIAVLPMPTCSAEDAAWNGAEILKQRIVFAVTCANADVYVITLPLTPPSHESKARPELRQSLLAGNAGKGAWGETLTLLGGQGRPSEGVAITLTRNKSASGPRSRSLERQGHLATRAIVAAHSREASGTLRLWDITLDAKPGTLNRIEPFQTELLPHPLTSISFNPLHITQLLTVDSPHAARVYDYSVPAFPSDDTSDGPFPNQGSWLLSLYPPFTRSSGMSTARKPIVAAEWIAHGRAVLVLLADGQWGVWDIDGASPSTNTSGSLFSKASAGLRGSAIAAFSVSGHLEGTSPLRNPGSQRSTTTGPSTGEFVPMTPHSRRDAIAATISGGPEKLAAVRGGITVARLTPTRSSEPGDESAILWLGGADPIVSVIPVISKFWESQLRRAVGGGVNLWSGSQPTRMIRLADLNAGLVGERCAGATAIPKLGAAPSRDSSPSEAGVGGQEGLPIEVLIQGETRLVVVHETEDVTSLTTRLIGARKKTRVNTDSTKAILAYPRPEKPNSVAFNLSVARRGNQMMQLKPRPSVKSLFAEPVTSIEAPEEASFGSQRPRDTGLMFINDLNNAADVPDDESEAANRDIEQEMMDIMEIDRELEQMETDRERGTKRVFFEEG